MSTVVVFALTGKILIFNRDLSSLCEHVHGNQKILIHCKLTWRPSLSCLTICATLSSLYFFLLVRKSRRSPPAHPSMTRRWRSATPKRNFTFEFIKKTKKKLKKQKKPNNRNHLFLSMVELFFIPSKNFLFFYFMVSLKCHGP